MDVPGLLWSVGIAAAGHPRVAEGRLGGPTLAPRNLSYLFDCRLVADAVEKVFCGDIRKFSKAADAFYARRRVGPHRVSEKRPRTFVSELRSIAAAE